MGASSLTPQSAGPRAAAQDNWRGSSMRDRLVLIAEASAERGIQH